MINEMIRRVCERYGLTYQEAMALTLHQLAILAEAN